MSEGLTIDRTRFLFFVGAIAAGCSPRNEATSPPGGALASTSASPTTTSMGASTTSTTGTSAIGTPATSTPPTTTNWPKPTGDGYGPPKEGSWPTPTAEGYWPGGGGPVGEGGGAWAPPPKKKPSPTPICGIDENVGKPGSCTTLKIDKSCSPFPFINGACSDAVRFYKPKIAERAVTCIRSKSPLQLCDALHVYDCKDDALHTACPDPGADPYCGVITQSCKGVSPVECRTYLSGMNALGRNEMVKCMQQNCGFGLYSCSEGL